MKPRVAIIDLGLGNLFSVEQACALADLAPFVTASTAEVASADAIILPGVGAFGDAMETLRRSRLDESILEAVETNKIVVGICLGMQLLCSESEEFGSHGGLGVVEGRVKRLPDGMRDPSGRPLKVPHIGWSAVDRSGAGWERTPLAGTPSGEPFYFVHSFAVSPSDPAVAMATTKYGDAVFCSALRKGDSVFAFQFHPERSGPAGIRIYHELNRIVRERRDNRRLP